MKRTSQSKYSWDLNSLYSSEDDPQIEADLKIIKKECNKFITKWKNREDYLENPKILKEALDEYEIWFRKYGNDGKVGYYFALRNYQNENDPKIKAKLNQIVEFATKIENDIQFFQLKLAKIPVDKQKLLLNSPLLAPYRHALEKLFAEKAHLLTEAEEKILNLKAPVSHSNWVKMLSGFLVKEEKQVITESGKKELKNFSELMGLLRSTKRKVRDSAAQAINDILEKYVDVAENEFNSVLMNKKINDELRKYPRPDSARHLSSDIDTKTVDALITAVSQNFHLAQRFYKFKARLFKVKKLQYHERVVPYGKIDRRYTFEEAVDLINKAFSDTEPEFIQILNNFIKEGRIDVLPKKGKHGGAFCIHHLISQPTYILLNYNFGIDDILTLAHELGHGINFELMKSQNSLNFSSPLSTAEVASTFMEDFVLEEILKEADEELKLSIMVNKLDDEVATVFRQIASYRFEQEIHQLFRQKGYLPKEEIGVVFQKHMMSYMGPAVEQSPGSQNWWVYWSHLRNFFYNYSYANGLLISKTLQSMVKKDPKTITKVTEFLSAGSSQSPENIFKKLGIKISDPNFWKQGLGETAKLLKEAEYTAKKLGKI